ncbi:MAG: hypothetical protein M1834_001001 [Cirrosporium novae-zelandiae]|nr:MAG: hypothetical protein M1834_001001 [Cirrosporium novae-zelandiae]
MTLYSKAELLWEFVDGTYLKPNKLPEIESITPFVFAQEDERGVDEFDGGKGEDALRSAEKEIQRLREADDTTATNAPPPLPLALLVLVLKYSASTDNELEFEKTAGAPLPLEDIKILLETITQDVTIVEGTDILRPTRGEEVLSHQEVKQTYETAAVAANIHEADTLGQESNEAD